jgi:alpha-N-arabinofuranosidase
VPPTEQVARGDLLHFAVTLEQAGTIWLDQMFLFPADHVDGWDLEIVDHLKRAKVPLLRFPGGNFVSGYHFKDGIGPVDGRPVRTNPAWFGVEWNHVGTDEWLRLCDLVGAEPLICVNAGNGSAQEAAEWLEYVNGAVTTPMGALRAANGQATPYGVKLWEIGNELWGEWQIGHTDAAGHAERYAAFHAAMFAVDPTVAFIANGGDAHWNRELLERNPTTVRSLSVHTLSGWNVPESADPDEVYLELMGQLHWYPSELAQLAAPMVAKGLAPRLAITELQIVSRSPNNGSLAEALWTAGVYNIAIRSGGAIEIITHSALVNHGGGLRKEVGVVYANPVWWASQLYSTASGVQPVETAVEGPTFSTEGSWLPAVHHCPYLDAVALLDDTGEALTLIVTNRHPTESLQTRVAVEGFRPDPSAAISVLTGDSYLAENSWNDPEAVGIEANTAEVAATFDHLFPAVSLTVLRLVNSEPQAFDGAVGDLDAGSGHGDAGSIADTGSCPECRCGSSGCAAFGGSAGRPIAWPLVGVVIVLLWIRRRDREGTGNA